MIMTKYELPTELMREWRHQIHANPELGFEEEATSALVRDLLTSWGYEVTSGFAITGLVGQRVFGDGTGPKIGIRADMDALTLQEETGLPYQSRNPGKMHACGHDGHTAILLGAAKAISELDVDGFNGTLNLIFQPAEEVGGGGGAQRMMEDGLFDKFPCDLIFALHNYPGVPVGSLAFRPGPFMCSSDLVKLTFKGKGGHGGLPHMAIDPTQPLAGTISALQSIVGRNIDPMYTGVISVGKVHAGHSYNIIPTTAEIELSVRALQREVRETLEARIRELADFQAKSFGCSVQIDYKFGYPVLVNDSAATEEIIAAASKVFSTAEVDAQALPLTGSEDFAYMLQQVPGCYLLIGNGDNGHSGGERVGPCSVHNPHYDFNDESLSTGAQLWLALCEHFFHDQNR